MLTSRGILRAVHRAVRARGVDVRHVLMVGTGLQVRDLTRTLRTHTKYGQRPTAFVGGGSVPEVDGVPLAGTPEEVLSAVRRVGAHWVIIVLPATASETTMQVAAICQELERRLPIVPNLYTQIASGADVELVERLPLLALRGSPLAGWAVGSRMRWISSERRSACSSPYLALLFSAAVLNDLYTNPKYHVFNWRWVAALLDSETGPNDLIVVTPGFDRFPRSWYFQGGQPMRH